MRMQLVLRCASPGHPRSARLPAGDWKTLPCPMPAERCVCCIASSLTVLCGLNSLHTAGAMQVVNKNADSVRDEIEAAIYEAAVSILAGEGFSFGVPSRAKGNQLCVWLHTGMPACTAVVCT